MFSLKAGVAVATNLFLNWDLGPSVHIDTRLTVSGRVSRCLAM